MTFNNPVWLMLAFPLLAWLFFCPLPKRSLMILRVSLLLMLLLALAGLSLRLDSGEGNVIVLADRSFSMPGDFNRLQEEACGILEKSHRSGQRLGVVSFAAGTVIEKMPDTPVFDGFKAELDRNQSNLKDAMETALNLLPYHCPGRIVILSDGCWTGSDPAVFFAMAASRGIPVDFRQVARPSINDLAIADVIAPGNVPAGDYYSVGLTIRAPVKVEAEYSLERNGKVYAGGKISLKQGDNQFFFKDRGLSPQTIRYAFNVRGVGKDDPRPENNRAEFLVKVSGQRPLLLITMSRSSSLGKLLRQSGVDTQIRLPGEIGYSLAELSSYSGIIIENTSADLIGEYGMASIASLVKNGMIGLMMTGGKNSFALGGYFKSPLEDILPVSMELRQEHRKLSMAVVVTLDRSGSMAAPVGVGKTKIDLANLATVEVLNMLAPEDEIGVFAVDSTAHEVIPLCTAGAAAGAVDKILQIQSMGGGIFVYEALSKAAAVLAKSKAGTRHIILFADAADSEEPGQYAELLKKCASAGITVSVIGLGKPTDCDALLLKDVALRGGGRCFFSDDAMELPRLFAQDTFVIARNTFIEEVTGVSVNNALRMFRSQGFKGPFKLGGYNLCYLRPQAQAGAVTVDEYNAPVVAFWYAETGRVSVFTGEADGKFSGPFTQWADASDLLVAISRWTAGYGENRLPGNMMLSQETGRGVYRIRLHLDPERKHDPFQKLPEVVTLSGATGRAPGTVRHTMQWDTPDSLVLEVPLTGNETSLSTVNIEKIPPQVMAPVTLPYSPEFRPADRGEYRSSLEQLCRMTGGKERVDLAAVWQEMPVVRRWKNIAPWLLVAAAVLLLLEVLERRTGLVSRLFGRRLFHFSRREKVVVSDSEAVAPSPGDRKKIKRRSNAEPEAAKPEKEVAITSVVPPEQHDGGLFAAMDKAKKFSRKK